MQKKKKTQICIDFHFQRLLLSLQKRTFILISLVTWTLEIHWSANLLKPLANRQVVIWLCICWWFCSFLHLLFYCPFKCGIRMEFRPAAHLSRCIKNWNDTKMPMGPKPYRSIQPNQLHRTNRSKQREMNDAGALTLSQAQIDIEILKMPRDWTKKRQSIFIMQYKLIIKVLDREPNAKKIKMVMYSLER